MTVFKQSPGDAVAVNPGGRDFPPSSACGQAGGSPITIEKMIEPELLDALKRSRYLLARLERDAAELECYTHAVCDGLAQRDPTMMACGREAMSNAIAAARRVVAGLEAVVETDRSGEAGLRPGGE